MTRATRAERAIAAVLLVAVAIPFWAGRYLPLLDLPQHLGLSAVIAHRGDPGSGFPRYYALDPGVTPYWTYYALMWALARVADLETANRLVLTAYAVAVPLGVAYLLSSFGRDRRWAVLSVPLVFSTNLFFGFATFLVSVPLFLFALGASERFLSAARPLAPRGLLAAILAVLVFLSHAQTYLLLGLCVLVLFAIHVRRAGSLAGSSVPYLPSLALFGIWFAHSFFDRGRAGAEVHTPHWHTYGTLGRLGAVYEPWTAVLRAIPERLLGAFTDGSDTLLGAALLVLFLVALVMGGMEGRRGASVPPLAEDPRPDRRARVGGDVLVLVLIAAYLLTPIQISGQWYLNARYLVFAALAAPLLLHAPVRGWRTVLASTGAVVGVLASLNTAAKIREFQNQVGDFEAIAAQLPRGGRVLGLPFDLGAGGPVRLWPFLHWACWQQVRAGGDVGFSFAGLPSIPVRYRTGMQAPHPYEWLPEGFDWASMGPWYDAFLVSGVPRGRGGAELRSHAESVVRAGTWSLWRPRNGLTDRVPSSR